MIDPETIFQLISSIFGVIRQVEKAEGAERAFEELRKMTAFMAALRGGTLARLDVDQTRAELDLLIERLMKHEEIKRGEAEADAALAKKFDTED